MLLTLLHRYSKQITFVEMGVDLKIIANNKVSFKEPESVIEKFTKKLNLDSSNRMIDWFSNLYYDYPRPENEVTLYVYKEFSNDWKKQWNEKGYLSFKGPLCTIIINENFLSIESFFRFAFYAGSVELANELSYFVKSLIKQLDGTEAIFLPDSIPFAQELLGSVSNPVYVQGKPNNLKELGKIYAERIYPMTATYNEVKYYIHKGYGEPCLNSKEIVEKEMLGYFIEKY